MSSAITRRFSLIAEAAAIVSVALVYDRKSNICSMKNFRRKSINQDFLSLILATGSTSPPQERAWKSLNPGIRANHPSASRTTMCQGTTSTKARIAMIASKSAPAAIADLHALVTMQMIAWITSAGAIIPNASTNVRSAAITRIIFVSAHHVTRVFTASRTAISACLRQIIALDAWGSKKENSAFSTSSIPKTSMKNWLKESSGI